MRDYWYVYKESQESQNEAVATEVLASGTKFTKGLKLLVIKINNILKIKVKVKLWTEYQFLKINP